MADQPDRQNPEPVRETEGATLRIRLPGFLVDAPIGLGDVIKRATSAVGIAPCGGCDSRAATLNRWIVFTTRTGRSG